MLKIKDNVDLKELEKYGFRPRYNTYTGQIDFYELFPENKLSIRMDCPVYRRIACDKYYDIAEILYDLIKDGLVEKVQDD